MCVCAERSCSCSLHTYYIYAGVHSFALVCLCAVCAARAVDAGGGRRRCERVRGLKARALNVWPRADAAQTPF